MNTTFQTLLIILIIKHGFNAIKSCELKEEKCICTFLTGTLIKMDCSNKSQNQLNIMDLDFDLKFSNPNKYFIELNIQNKLLDSQFIKTIKENASNSNLKLIKTLTFANNKIFFGNKSDLGPPFQNLVLLNKLNLYSNNLTEIDPKWFLNINQNFTQLNLSSNQLRIIKNDTFLTLNKLELLYLYFNEIEVLELNSFRGLVNLRFLHLYENKIRFVQENLFFNLANLNELFFHQNNLNQIESNTFNQFGNVKELRLNYNQIRDIQNSTFINLNKLEFLLLSFNQIEYLNENTFIGLYSLKELFLDNNKISFIDVKSFSNLTNLTKIRLTFNLLVHIESSIFDDLFNLKDLNLNLNQIKKFRVNKLEKLGYLDLYLNDIDELEINAFEGNLTSLIEIQLNSNKIKILRENLFKNVQNLQKLNLAQNQLSSIENNSFNCWNIIIYTIIIYNLFNLFIFSFIF